MFYDRESMIDMFELAMGKIHIEASKWYPVLINCSMQSFKPAKDDVINRVMIQWVELVEREFRDKDAAYLINEGNIFGLIHESHYSDLSDRLTENAAILLLGVARFTTNVRPLDPNEARFLLMV